MVVNDLICNFAKPMYFLDYFATAKLDVEKATTIIKGIVEGCKMADCALIGGESAEMPDMYKKDDFDLAGFAVGIAEKDEIDRIPHIKDNNILVALRSSGIHSNGYSLVRHVLFKKLGKNFNETIDGKKIIDILLEPTKIYTKTFSNIKSNINAISHITGGGIVENLPRILPQGVDAIIEKDKIQSQEIFNFLSKYVSSEEMYKTFNMGVGMIACVDEDKVDEVLKNCDGYVIGHLKNNSSSNSKVHLV
jgi:phosphoribosylformylglycinamidine cyclo-ligase